MACEIVNELLHRHSSGAFSPEFLKVRRDQDDAMLTGYSETQYGPPDNDSDGFGGTNTVCS